MIDSTTASERFTGPRVSVGCPLGVGLRTTAQPARLWRARPLRPGSGRRDRTVLGGRDVRRPRGRRVRPAAGSAAIRWGGLRAQGFAWSEARPAQRNVASWKDAACELAACGLVAHRERRRVHSSVSGVAPIYYVEHAGAVYFASRIDPLVQVLPRRYTIDWRAWASIFYLRFPIGDRTPFQEVKRLRPFSTLEWDADHREAKPRQHRWPWAEVVQPSLGLDDGASALAEAMRAAVAP